MNVIDERLAISGRRGLVFVQFEGITDPLPKLESYFSGKSITGVTKYNKYYYAWF
jgi:hypothetical protein